MGRKPCCAKVGLNRGAWTATEDKTLVDYIRLHGAGHWRNIPQRAGLKRCGKSCRLRWINYLRPDIKRGNITNDEEELIIRLHKLLGNRWSLIAGRLPGRTDNEIKNYWNTTLCKKLQTGGAQTSRRKVDQSKKNPNQPTESKMNNNPLVIRTKPTRLKRSPSFMAAPLVVAGEGESSGNNNSSTTGEKTQSPGLFSEEKEPTGFMKDFEIDEKFFLEFFNMEFEGSPQDCSPCINDQQMGHSSSPDSDDHYSNGILVSDQMLHEYSASLIDPESDWLQDYVADPNTQ